MPRLLQQLLTPLEAFAPVLAEAEASAGPREDEVPLGCECADPVLQFDSWEPLPAPPSLILSSKS